MYLKVVPCINLIIHAQLRDTYIYIIYTPNLALRITVFDLAREQARFRGSIEGAALEEITPLLHKPLYSKALQGWI